MTVVGCNRDEQRDEQQGDEASVLSESSARPVVGQREAALSVPPDGPRPVHVAEADRLAVAGAERVGEAGATLLSRAAALREALWRRDQKQVDALEAIELLHSVADRAGSGACEAKLRAALIRGELNGDPAQTYREVYLLLKRDPNHDCRRRAERSLAVLESVKPPDRVLAELDASVQQDAGAKAADAEEGPPHVIQPQLLEEQLSKPSEITKVEHYGAEDSARVVVHVSHPTKFEVGTIPAQGGVTPRLFVDVERASYSGEAQFSVGGLVEATRLGARESGTRVVLDLSEEVHHRVFYLPDPFRLVIDVSRESPDRLLEPRQISRIVLDPGHGGSDPGATGPNGLREKDVTLDIAHRAAPLLAREIGVSTLLTRDTDEYVPLDERAARANAFGADLFISIHCNASPDGSQHGVMTFVLDASKDSLAARIAARENDSTAAAAAELANSLSRLGSSARRAASYKLAHLLQQASVASLGRLHADVRDHGVRPAGFYVLAGARMPAALYEASFISNLIEAERLNAGAYRQRLADAIVNAVRAYREGH